jgi:lambda family phage portal protein
MSDPLAEILGDAPEPPRPLVSVTRTAPASATTGGGFDGADRVDAAMALWGPLLRSADADIIPDKDIVDGRARDMVRNDAYIQGGANLHKDNIVGSHFLLNTRPSSRALFGQQDDVWEEEFQEEVEELWDLYAESPDNWLDAQRTNSFTSLVRLAVGVHLMGGEVLAVAEWLTDGRPMSTAIQMIDLDRLSDPMTPGTPIWRDRDSIRGGIRFNAQGAPTSYFIRSEHPADLYTNIRYKLPEWKEVAIRKPWGRLQVIHIHEQVRPDQSRGIPEMAAALKEMRFGQRLRGVRLQREIMQSLYAAAITSELPSAEVFAALGGQALGSSESVQNALTNFATGYLGSVQEYVGGSKALKLDGARIAHLYPGTKLEMLRPGDTTDGSQLFEQSLLRYLAASLGVSYEQLSRDYTNTNYSSARAAMTETWKFMQARKKLVADRFASLIFRLWLEEAIRKNLITSFPARRASMLYSPTGSRGRDVLNLKFDAISRCDWVGASRGQIDELKETQAAVLRINSGLSTREDELARLGKDFRKVYRQLAREKRLEEANNLNFSAALGSASTGNDNSDNRGAAA